MKKIIMIGSLPPPYHGTNIYFQNLLRSRITEEFDVYHLDTSDHRDLNNLSKLDLINVYLAIKNLFELFIVLFRFKPALVYLAPSPSILPYIRDGLFILITHFFSHAKIVIHMHAGMDFREKFFEKSNFLTRAFVRNTLKKVHTAIVLGDNLKRILIGLVDKVIVIPNGTDFNLRLQETIIKFNKVVTISFLGSLVKRKGVLDILEAAKYVLKKHRNVIFKLGGSWRLQEIETKKEAYRIIKRNDYAEHIDFIGMVFGDEKINFFLDTDIFVFPSHNDSFGIVNIEAMSAECAVISSRNVGAINEIVEDGVTGLLVERKNPKKLADAILNLLDNVDVRISMGKAGRKRYEKLFTMKRNTDKFIELFTNILQET